MQIGMLGPLQVRTHDGVPLAIPGARLRALLVRLAQEPGRLIPNATLIDWIWGEQPPAGAANALHRLVSRLRRALPDGVVEGQPGGYRLAVAPDDVDAVRFERLLQQARDHQAREQRPHGPQAREQQARDHQTRDLRARERHGLHLLREALNLWRGQAMEDVILPDSPALQAAAIRLEELRKVATEDWFDAEIGAGAGHHLIPELTDLVTADPTRERLTAALIRALAAAGRPTEALQAYERTRSALAEAFGTDPSADLAALHVTLLRGELTPDPATPTTNLRAELTTFIGKDDDVAAVRERITNHRLTTLTGPGGAGKTRLATEATRTLLEEFPDGVWLVELASLDVAAGPTSDPATEPATEPASEVAQATFAALGLRDALHGTASPADVTRALIAAIRDRQALLILDNCEHVIDAAATFAHQLLGECHALRIVATTREPLNIPGEALWPVEPLALPEPGAAADQIIASPAVQLLADRARTVRPDLTTAPDTATTMARICCALDGNPLAIELAAARLRTMTLAQVADRLDDRFRLLTGGSRAALPRHQTLRAAVDWSWDLLIDAERAVLRRLSVFTGGIGIEAAERVCTDHTGDEIAENGKQQRPDGGTQRPGGVQQAAHDGEQMPDDERGQPQPVERAEVLGLLGSLTEKSLLIADGGGEPRYRMLSTIQTYARHRLVESGEADQARRAHLAHVTDLAETAEPHLRRAEQLEWLAVLGQEHENISAAMRGALAAGEAHPAMRLAAAVGWYWWLSGHRMEGMELLTAAAGVPSDAESRVPDETRAMVYALITNFLSSGRGDQDQAEMWIREAHRLSQRIEHPHPLLGLIAPLERMLNAPEDVVDAFEPLLDAEDPWVRALARLHLGKMRIILGQGGRDADAHLEQALTEFRAIGERFGISFALIELADRIATRGEFTTAREYYDQGIAVVSEVGAIEDVIRMRCHQAQLYWLLGDSRASTAAIAEAERLAQRVAWPDATTELAFSTAELARWRGDHDHARDQLEVATALLGEGADWANIRALVHDLRGYLAKDLQEAREHRATAWQAASEVWQAPLIAQVIVGVADLALRREEFDQAARLLAASTDVRGLPDRSHPDAARIEQTLRRRLGEARLAALAREGTKASGPELVAATLGC